MWKDKQKLGGQCASFVYNSYPLAPDKGNGLHVYIVHDLDHDCGADMHVYYIAHCASTQ